MEPMKKKATLEEIEKRLQEKGIETIAYKLSPDTIDEETRTVELTYTTGAKVKRFDYRSGEFFEQELSLEPGAVRLERLKAGAPLLNSHWDMTLEDVVGVVLDADETTAKVKFSERDSVEPIWRDVKDGIIKNVSVGFHIHRNEDVTPEGSSIRIKRAVDWEPVEISLVPVPADAGAQVRRMEAHKEDERANHEEKEQNNMDPKEKKEETAAAAATVATAEAKTEADTTEVRKAESKRFQEITEIAKRANLGLDFVDEAVKSDLSVEQVRAKAFDNLCEKSKDTEIRATIEITKSEADNKREAAEKALSRRAQPHKHEFEAGNIFNNMSLLEMGRYFLEANGHNVSTLDRSEIAVRAMHSTSDFPAILANVANKTIQQAYMDTPKTFQPFCRLATLTDFKPVNRTKLSEMPTPKLVTENGEFEYVSVSDEKETYQLATYGEILAITRQTIINDDLDAFGRIPTLMGAAAARLEGDLVYAILTGNPNMGDGVALFDNAHANLTDAKLLADEDGLGDAEELMAKQKGPKGVANLNLMPSFIITGPTQKIAAMKALTGVSPNQASQVNPFANAYQLIVDQRITGNDYFLSASPNVIDTIEYGYLAGQSGPQISTREGFNIDGMEIKLRHDFAAKAIDHRGLVKSTNDRA